MRGHIGLLGAKRPHDIGLVLPKLIGNMTPTAQLITNHGRTELSGYTASTPARTGIQTYKWLVNFKEGIKPS